MKTIYYKVLIPILLTGLTLISFSCQEEESAWFPVVGRGNVQTEYRNAEHFQKIKCLMSGDVIIQQSKSQTLRVSAQENLLALLETKVVNGTLLITFGSHVIETDSIVTVFVSIPEINEMTFSVTGNVISNLGIPIINLTGSGNIRCTGETDQVSVKLSGSGTVNLDEMKVKTANVKISGNGNVSLNVTDNLDVSIPGMGVVYYRGMPNVQKNITGMGQVIEKNEKMSTQL